MARIKINDLPKDMTFNEKEIRVVRGGFGLGDVFNGMYWVATNVVPGIPTGLYDFFNGTSTGGSGGGGGGGSGSGQDYRTHRK